MPTDLVVAAGGAFDVAPPRLRDDPPAHRPRPAEHRRGGSRRSSGPSTVPRARDFGIVGTARLPLGAPDNTMDSALGHPDASSGGLTVNVLRAHDHDRLGARLVGRSTVTRPPRGAPRSATPSGSGSTCRRPSR